MIINEMTLITFMRNVPSKRQRTILLERYVQKYGSLSPECWEKVRKLIEEGE